MQTRRDDCVPLDLPARAPVVVITSPVAHAAPAIHRSNGLKDTAGVPVEYMGLDLSRSDISVRELLLDNANVIAHFEKVSCERMPQGVRTQWLDHARTNTRWLGIVVPAVREIDLKKVPKEAAPLKICRKTCKCHIRMRSTAIDRIQPKQRALRAASFPAACLIG